LYANLDWLQTQQVVIEQKLFHRLHRGQPPELFLYDVTSSYLEGEHINWRLWLLLLCQIKTQPIDLAQIHIKLVKLIKS